MEGTNRFYSPQICKYHQTIRGITARFCTLDPREIGFLHQNHYFEFIEKERYLNNDTTPKSKITNASIVPGSEIVHRAI